MPDFPPRDTFENGASAASSVRNSRSALGGALSILAAIHVPELDGACCWYGVPPPEAGDPRMIRIPLQGHFALEDQYFPPSVVDALEAKLKEAGVSYEFYRYPASHGFGRDSSPYYDPQAAELAWQRSLAFLARFCVSTRARVFIELIVVCI